MATWDALWGYGRTKPIEDDDYHSYGRSTVYKEVEAAGAAAVLKHYNGAAWVTATLKQYNGAAWVAATLKHYGGSSWEDAN